MIVAEAMNKDVKTIRPDATVKEAVQIMTQNRIGSVVVISGGGEVMGIVTEHDVLKDVVGEGKDSASIRVDEVMTSKIVAIDPNQTIEEAADVMVKHKIKKLPVIDDGKLIGIITASDLIRYERTLIERVATLISASPMRQIGG